MKTFAARRRRNLTLLALAVACMLALSLVWHVAVLPGAFPSGWALLAIVLFLASYSLRKLMPFLPLLASSTWLQCHIYAGLFSAALFLVHIGFRVPNGLFERILAGAYLITFFSGLFGLWLMRVIPARLTARGQEVLYERIPIFLRQVRQNVEQLVFACLSQTETTAVPEFYLDKLQPFFERPRNFWSHVVHSERPLRELLLAINNQRRFLNSEERNVMEQITEFVRTKDDLDYQYALQSTLKYWLFLHVPLSAALVVLALFHLLVVLAFAGGTG